MKYKIEIFDNHLILLYKDSRFLIDTGAPITISNLNPIEIFESEAWARYDKNLEEENNIVI